MLRIKYIAFLIFVFMYSPHASYAQQYVSQGAWAVYLVRNAGWEKNGIPIKPFMNDYFDLLSGRNFINVNLRGYTSRLGDTPDTLIYNINAAHSGRYHLIAYVTGNPLFFAIDKTSTASAASGTWGYQDLGTFILSRGIHSLHITMPGGSSIAALYLSSFVSDIVAPAGGWNTAGTLYYGAEAETIGMMLRSYDQIPLTGTIPYTVQSSKDTSKFVFRTPSSAVMNIALTFTGPSAGYVMIDSSVVFTYSTMDNHTPPVKLSTISIGAGVHTAFLKVQSGQMPVSVVINSHDTSAAAFAGLMRTKGYDIGIENQPVFYSSTVNVLAKFKQDAKAVYDTYYTPGLSEAPVEDHEFSSVSGCGNTSGTIEYKPGTVKIPDNTFIAVAPFENLTDAKDATAAISGILQEALIESSNVWVTDWDKVADQLAYYGFDRGIPIGMTLAKTIVSKLRVSMILYGSVFEYGYRTGPDGKANIPSVGVELSLLNVQTGRVLFAGSFAQSGRQGESLEDTAKALASKIFVEMGR